MKTRNAFWLRDFDETRILQRPYFKDFHFREFQFRGKTDEEILSILGTLDDYWVYSEGNLSVLRDLHERLIQFNNKIVRYLAWYTVHNKKSPIEGITASWAAFKLQRKVENQFYIYNRNIQEEFKIDFTKRLRKYRKAAGLTQKELGELIHVSPRSMSYYERGERDIPMHTLRRICQILNVSADKLLGIT